MRKWTDEATLLTAIGAIVLMLLAMTGLTLSATSDPRVRAGLLALLGGGLLVGAAAALAVRRIKRSVRETAASLSALTMSVAKIQAASARMAGIVGAIECLAQASDLTGTSTVAAEFGANVLAFAPRPRPTGPYTLES